MNSIALGNPGALRPCVVSHASTLPRLFTAVFYDMECLATSSSLECPTGMADDFISSFARDLRIESSTLRALQFLFAVCLVHCTGIPLPRDWKGRIMFWSWMLLQVAQLVLSVASLITLLLSFRGAAEKFGDCAVGGSRLNVVAMLTFTFNPSVIVEMGSVGLALESTRNGLIVFHESRWVHFFATLSTYICSVALGVPYFASIILAITWLVFSGSFAFGVMFIPIALAFTLCVVVALFMWFVAFKTFVLCGCVRATSLSWATLVWKNIPIDMGPGLTLHCHEDVLTPLNFFHILLVKTLILLMTSPLAIWGAWLALYIYEGAGTEKVLDMLHEIYSWVFTVLATHDFEQLSVLFDPSQITTVDKALAELSEFFSVPPAQQMAYSSFFSSLSFLMCFLRTFVSAASLVRDRYSQVCATLPYIVCLHAVKSDEPIVREFLFGGRQRSSSDAARQVEVIPTLLGQSRSLLKVSQIVPLAPTRSQAAGIATCHMPSP